VELEYHPGALVSTKTPPSLGAPDAADCPMGCRYVIAARIETEWLNVSGAPSGIR